jgi:hypothetical protein
MSRRQQLTDQALKVVGTLFLALLAWQGKSTLSRLDRLERNQTVILVHLGIPPVASLSLEKRAGNALFAAAE